ncbi:hypothetical protein [Nonomuraea typhae]|uniref:Nucleotidyltransferase domain-containing protein n=1 Tax=Nonomuraea typhae TaxID=2603600 RepID=A0ABW7YMZ4_9ACTN
MKVKEAREAAARWAAGIACDGAFLTGSVTWLDDGDDLPGSSDVDVFLVAGEQRPKLGKFLHDGVLLEATFITWDEIPSAAAILGHYHLAGAFRRDNVLADPTGRLRELQSEVAPAWAAPHWVHRRCEHAESRILKGLAGAAAAEPYPMAVLRWLFATGVTTHVLLTAGLRNPTVRLRYPEVRRLLMPYGRARLYEALLELLGSERLGPGRVERHLAAMTRAFDAAAGADGSPYPFASDISPQARHIAVDGSRELIERGLHREAMFWITATHARSLLVLGTDTPAFHELVADLRIGSLEARAEEVRAFLPRLRRAAEKIIVLRGDASPPPAGA